MKPYFWLLTLIVLTIETFSILPARRITAPKPAAGAPLSKSGIIHVHSLFSHDGGGSVEKIAAAAKLAGHDFVILTDHDNTRARREGLEKTIGGVDVFVEMEASLPAGHALFFSSHTDLVKLEDEAIHDKAWDHFQGTSSTTGAFLATAHPSNVKNPWNRFDRYPDGTEVINFDSLWQRQLSDSFFDFLLTAAIIPFNPYLASLRFFQVYPKDFVAWDNMNTLSKGHFGILAHDTHERLKITRATSIPWPTYEQTFRLGSNVVFLTNDLSDDFSERKKAVYQSIREGRSAMLFQAIHPFAGNDWYLQCQDSRYRSGDELSLRDGCEFVVETPETLPFPRTIRLIKDGQRVEGQNNAPQSVRYPLKNAGVYRLEIGVTPRSLMGLFLNREVPYLFYNPIYVR